MHGLLGDRFLKWFLGGVRRRPRFTPTNQTASDPECDDEMPSTLDSSEHNEVKGKEKSRDIKQRMR